MSQLIHQYNKGSREDQCIFVLQANGKDPTQIKPKNNHIMLRWTITFIVLAIIAAVFGFGGIAAGAAGIAKILFFIFIVLFIISLLRGKKVF